ncbi:GNAT family N-acetyltransferase [Synechococcus sp. PCC 6312]|uniref:GNAT family N-acetyltransferase n=1 Tax=Synechococcus sp. (strain ATCC 27167 / PCC 6312) TaxID=195253 RepID=UPI00029F4ACC|nr:N-acetyltransferase [Synechococcus sp. PCC 6312]AFY62192.1 putative acetyltransferase [Synechococcus sp. PCC 6312]
MELKICPEQPADIPQVQRVNELAFGRGSEAELVNKLRGLVGTYSFVAVVQGQVVGHVFFSPVRILGQSPEHLSLLGLAPVAVLPDWQRKGIGQRLISQSLESLKLAGVAAIVVLGDPNYYQRFGFVTSQFHRLACEFDVPDEYFMVLELNLGCLRDSQGTIQYLPAFQELE